MSIIGIDIGSSTTKMIEYKDNIITNKRIIRRVYEEKDLQDFLEDNKIKDLEKVIFTGIGADRIDTSKYNIPTEKVEEFNAIGTGGVYLSKKEKIIIASIGTGTALIEVNNKKIKHIGGTGVGAGTLLNLCDRFLKVSDFDEILELSQKGEIEKIDLRIGDVTNKDIETLPKDLTLANFGKLEKDAKREDILFGFVNMIFEVIGMMVAFATVNSEIKEAVLIGNITVIPGIKEILRKIEFTHKINFIIPANAEYGVVLGAIINSIEKVEENNAKI